MSRRIRTIVSQLFLVLRVDSGLVVIDVWACAVVVVLGQLAHHVGGDEPHVKHPIEDIKSDIEVLSGCPVVIMEQTPNSASYSFAITEPKYRVGGGRLLSQRADEIENILMKRYQGKDVTISVSRNCVR